MPITLVKADKTRFLVLKTLLLSHSLQLIMNNG